MDAQLNLRLLLGFVAFFAMSLFSCAWESETDEDDPAMIEFRHAQKLVSDGDFDEAVIALKTALRHDFTNKTIAAELDAVRNIIKLRNEFRNVKDSTRWSVLAQHLRLYYQKNGVKTEWVDISLQIFDKSKLTWDAVCVINAMIGAGRYNDALDFAESVDSNDKNPSIRISKGYIYYAAGELSEARKISKSLVMDELKTPDDLLRLARLQAVTNLHASSVKTLVRCFELTPINSLPSFKEYVVKLPEFEPLRPSSEFAEALTTMSKQENTTRSCSQKWVGVVIDQRPKYIKDLAKGPINPDDWKVNPLDDATSAPAAVSGTVHVASQ